MKGDKEILRNLILKDHLFILFNMVFENRLPFLFPRLIKRKQKTSCTIFKVNISASCNKAFFWIWTKDFYFMYYSVLYALNTAQYIAAFSAVFISTKYSTICEVYIQGWAKVG